VSFSILQRELRKHLDENTRKVLVILLGVPPVLRNKLIANEYELLTFLESSGLLSEEDVSPLLKAVRSANYPSLSSIIHLLENYQPYPIYGIQLEKLRRESKSQGGYLGYDSASVPYLLQVESQFYKKKIRVTKQGLYLVIYRHSTVTETI
jgi:hypothetical protein